jgi:glycosyltransferase involved in cell wall biosynthesis
VKIFVLTDIPSPYQTEIFNEVAMIGCELHVGYLRRRDSARQWNQVKIHHDSTMLDGGPSELSTARSIMADSDLAVFNYYRHPNAEQLLTQRATQQRPWCFWGERPGLRTPEWAGRIVRHWKLRPLHRSPAPIWGIGQFAVDQYKREFGATRAYRNLPYFSDLKRFHVDRYNNGNPAPERVFLFSGALTARKGVDLLAECFNDLARERRNVRLRIVGDGPLLSNLRTRLSVVRDKVEFIGFKDWNDLPAQYAAADLLCVPSRYDGWGLVVPEGLASGLPVIATDRMGSALEFIKNSHNGWLVSAGDRKALLNAMFEAATISKDELSRYSSNARESVREHSLQDGARRFLQYATDAVANWQA